MMCNTTVGYTANKIHLYDTTQCWTNVEDFGPPLHKCYTNALCFQGILRQICMSSQSLMRQQTEHQHIRSKFYVAGTQKTLYRLQQISNSECLIIFFAPKTMMN